MKLIKAACEYIRSEERKTTNKVQRTCVCTRNFSSKIITLSASSEITIILRFSGTYRMSEMNLR